jgi:predicted metal-dependent hydrolase
MREGRELEMAHLIEVHHMTKFWCRVEPAMPDYDRQKTWLTENGLEVARS